MGDFNKKLARVDVLIGGVDQAKQKVEQMKNSVAGLKMAAEAAQQAMQKAVNTVDYDAYKKKYDTAEREYKKANRALTETQRNVKTVETYLTNISGQTLRNLNQAQKTLKQMLLGINPANVKDLEIVRDLMKQVADEAKRRKGDLVEFSDVFSEIGTASDASLSKAKTRLEELIASTKKGSAEMATYVKQLQLIKNEEKFRFQSSAENTLKDVRMGKFSGSMGDARKAIKQLEQYKDTFSSNDEDQINRINEAIEKLKTMTGEAKTEMMGYDEAIRKAASVADKTFNGTIEDVNKLKKALMELRAKTNVNDKKRLEEIDKALADLGQHAEQATMSMEDVADIVNHKLKTAPMEQLKAAAAALQKELEGAQRGTRDFVRASADLRRINTRIREVNRTWEAHENQIKATAKRLASYVMVYAGFNEVVGLIKQMTRANLELSDSLADIRKTTGLSAEAVAELSAEIDKIDTRTSQKELHDLAYEAGKLGLKAKEDVLGFVKAGNQLIAALGEDLGGAEAVRSLMKINDLLGETKKLGIEKALLATGSAMNELSQSSTASAGPIADIVARLGAVGAQSKLTMADLLAIGSTADSLSQDAEVVGTAMSKFITALQVNTHSIAQAVGLDDKGLEELMEGGQMMEAMIQVLERLGQMGADGMKNIAPVMKEFGSDGERLVKVVNAMAKNVDVLRRHVDLSNESFREATSVTNEYNIKNESSMALVTRMGNSIRETFVNSGIEKVINKFLKTIMSIPAFIERNIITLKILTSVIIGVSAALYANTLQWVKNINAMTAIQVTDKLAGFYDSLKLSLEKLNVATIKATFSLKNLKKVTSSLGKAVKGFLAANWLTILIGAVTAVGVAIYRLANHTSLAAKATKEFAGALAKEELESRALFRHLEALRGQKEKYKEVLDLINQRYGTYLGFMLTEVDSADKVAQAQELINAKIRERLALQLKERMNQNSVDKYGSLLQGALGKMNDKLVDTEGVGVSLAPKVLNIIQRVVDENLKIEKETQKEIPVWKIRESVFDTLHKEEGFEDVVFGIKGYVEDFIEARKDFEKELKITDEYVKHQVQTVGQDVAKETTDVLLQMMIEYKTAVKKYDSATESSDKKLRGEKLIKSAQDYINLAKTLNSEFTPEETLKKIMANVDEMEKRIEDLNPTKKFINIWGEGVTLATASVDQLVAKYKELFKERKTLKDDAQYNTIYSAQFKDRKNAMEWYLAKLKEVEKQLNSMGYDKNGNFLKDKNKKGKGDARDKVTAVMSALEAYYNREQQLIDESYINKEITEKEHQRRLLDNEQQFLLDRIALREKLLGKKGGEFFDPSKYVHTDADTGEVTKYFEGKDIDSLIKLVNKFGEFMRDGILNELTKDELVLYQRSMEHIQKIHKILLDNNFVGQVDKQYQEELEQLDLFWGLTENRTESNGEKRLKLMKDFSRMSYEITAKELKDRIEATEEFSDWSKVRSSEDYEALLLMLQKYYDDVEEAENREIARKQRISDKRWKKEGHADAWDAGVEGAEDNLNFAKDLQGLDMLDQDTVDDAEVRLYQARYSAAEEYYLFIKENGGDLVAAEEKRMEALTALNEVEMESTRHKMDILKSYTDNVIEFGAQMGEAAFGEVADRKAAAKQLLRSTMEVTKNLMLEYVKRLLFRKQIATAEVATEAATGATMTALHGTQAVTDITVEGAKTAASVPLGIAQGSAKTIGKLGWWGIPLIAVISAALSALMGLAMGKMNKAKKEVQAATGVGNSKARIAAGMLTYADGDYPILGNDGKVYNATYHDKLRTGVYGGGNGKAHFGLFSEKKPEMIVDGDTTQKIMLDYPHLYQSILTIANQGRLHSAAMPTFANGAYPMAPEGLPMGGDQMMATLDQLTATVSQLRDRLSRPIVAEVNPYGSKGAVRQMSRAEKFMRHTGQL